MLSCQKDQFQLPESRHYVNCAFMAPMSRRVEEAGLKAMHMRHDPSVVKPGDFFVHVDRLRAKFATLINVSDANRIALTGSTSYGIATVARNLTFDEHSNIVLLSEQFPSNVYSWHRIQQNCGAQIRVADAVASSKSRGEILTDEVCRLIDEQTVVASLPVVHWANGARLDLRRVRDRCDQFNTTLVIDGTQSVGALPFDAAEIRPDALICAGYKWLLGPYGSGLTYLGPKFDGGTPLEENWITRAGSEAFGGLVNYTDQYQPAAIRYDIGQRSDFIAVAMLEAGLDHLLSWGVDEIQSYCRDLVEPAVEKIRDLGYKVDDSDHRGSHLFGVTPPDGTSVRKIRESLDRNSVTVSVRGTSLRISPNVYNDSADIDALVGALKSAI